MQHRHWSHAFMHRHYLQLVIILSLIGILSFGAFVFFTESVDREDDLQRASDLRSVQAALEVFYNDYGTYPAAIGHSKDVNGNSIPALRVDQQQEMFPKMSTEDDVSFLSTLLFGGYLQELPMDPRHSEHFVYAYHSASEVAPGRRIPNQFYQLSAKFSARSSRETRAVVFQDGGDDRDDRNRPLYEIGNAVADILVTQDDWGAMVAPGDTDLNSARRTFIPSALGSGTTGKKLAPESVSGVYW